MHEDTLAHMLRLSLYGEAFTLVPEYLGAQRLPSKGMQAISIFNGDATYIYIQEKITKWLVHTIS